MTNKYSRDDRGGFFNPSDHSQSLESLLRQYTLIRDWKARQKSGAEKTTSVKKNLNGKNGLTQAE